MPQYIELTLPINNFIKKDFDPLTCDFAKPWEYILIDQELILSPETLNFFEKIGIHKLRCQFFRGSPNNESNIHIDGFLQEETVMSKRKWAINYVWGSDNSTMYWYRSVVNILNGKIGDTGNTHPIYLPHQVEEIEKYKFSKKPVLVHTTIPHKVVNNSDQYRWCVSLREENPSMNWDEAAEFFGERFTSINTG